jgi:hypothetical protein
MTRSTQHVCALVQVAPPHATGPPPSPPPLDPPSDAAPSEPLAEASLPLLPEAPLLDVLPDPPLLDVPPELPPELPPLEAPLLEVPLLDVPLLDVELPDEDPLPEPLEPPLELPPPSSPLPLPGELLDPPHAANPNNVPIRATTDSRIIASSSGAGEIPHKARASQRPPGGQWERDLDSLPPFAKTGGSVWGGWRASADRSPDGGLRRPRRRASCNPCNL